MIGAKGKAALIRQMSLEGKRTVDIIRELKCSPGAVSRVRRALRAEGLLKRSNVGRPWKSLKQPKRGGKSSESGACDGKVPQWVLEAEAAEEAAHMGGGSKIAPAAPIERTGASGEASEEPIPFASSKEVAGDPGIPASAIDSTSDLEWLRLVRDNPRVLWGDRIRAALAASKLEGSKTEDSWTPPTGDAWRDLLADLISSQSPEDREALRASLA